jgi:hypothetical protein
MLETELELAGRALPTLEESSEGVMPLVERVEEYLQPANRSAEISSAGKARMHRVRHSRNQRHERQNIPLVRH